MSRFPDAEWDGEGTPPEFWWQATRNAIKGKRGQVVLQELREALLALPAPRLIEGAVCQEGEVCAMGALARHRFQQGQTLTYMRQVVASLPELEEKCGNYLDDDWSTVELGEAMGLRRSMAWAIAYENDEGYWQGQTPEQRYRRVLHWVEENLAERKTG